MTEKQYLKQVYKLNEKIKDKQERINSLRLMSESIGAIDYSKDKIKLSPTNDAAFTNQIMQIIKFEEEFRWRIVLKMSSIVKNCLTAFMMLDARKQGA